MRQWVVGTGGKSHTNVDEAHLAPHSQRMNDSTFGVLRLDLSPTSYRWEFVPVAGKSFTDSGTADCH